VDQVLVSILVAPAAMFLMLGLEHLERRLLGSVAATTAVRDHPPLAGPAQTPVAAPYGLPSSERTNVRNGYRHRDFDTRAGTLDVAIPKLREGSYFPDWLLERRRRAERALTTVNVAGPAERRANDAGGIDHLERHDQGQLTDMTRREPLTGDGDHTRDDGIRAQRSFRWRRGCLGGRPLPAGAPIPSTALRGPVASVPSSPSRRRRPTRRSAARVPAPTANRHNRARSWSRYRASWPGHRGGDARAQESRGSGPL